MQKQKDFPSRALLCAMLDSLHSLILSYACKAIAGFAAYKLNMATCSMSPQAEALPRLCAQMRLAAGLRELALDLYGRAGSAVPVMFPELGRLTQLRSLQLSCVALDANSDLITAALSPLTRLTRLGLEFGDDGSLEYNDSMALPAFPWADAVCGLTNLQELRVILGVDDSDSDDDDDSSLCGMFRGCLPAALSQLRGLRHLEVLGMAAWGAGDEHNTPQLTAFPVLETVTLRLQQGETGQLPTLRPGQRIELSRLVSLSLALRVDADDDGYHQDMHVPMIVAPALTEVVFDGIKLAPDSEQLTWLPGLPKLRRLVLANMRIASKQLPRGIAACSSLTELSSKAFPDRLRRARRLRYGPTDSIRK